MILWPSITINVSLLIDCTLLQAAFLARLVGPDVAIASAHNSLKSISASSPGTELATRHCFLLEDPPSDSKEQAGPDRYVILLRSIYPLLVCVYSI